MTATARPVPVVFRWLDVDVVDGDGVVRTRPAMVPLHRFDKVCARQFDAGAAYMLAVEELPSDSARRHYFACLRTAWKNLPEAIAHRYPSVEHLRKTALIKAGYRTERHHPCSSYDEAIKVAALVKEMDEFCVTVVHPNNVVSIYTAESQATYRMKADRFRASKRAVLGLVAGLIGVSYEDLSRNSRQAEGDRGEDERNQDPALGEASGAARDLSHLPSAPRRERALPAPAVTAPPKSEDGR